MRQTSERWARGGIAALALAVVTLGAGQALVLARQAGQAELLMQAARNKQVVEGKLDEAIAIYRDVLANHGQNRPVAARALAGLGYCYEKLGAAQTSEARKAYERLVQQYPEQTELVAEARARLLALAPVGGAAAAPAGRALAVRRVWSKEDVSGKVSPDGRYVSFTHWGTGNLAIRDVASGEIRQLTAGTDPSKAYAEYSVPSPDGRRIAYAWSHSTYDLCVIGVDGSKPRVLRVSGGGVSRQFPLAWSPDGAQLLAEFVKTDGTRDLMLVAVADGSAKLVKAVGRNPSPGGVFSPDGRFIAWATREGLALFDLQTGAESPLISDRSSHTVLGWAPDGGHILFSSERTGSPDAWLIAVAGGKAQGEPVFVKRDWGFRPMGFTRAGAFYYAVNNNVGDVQVAEIDPASGKVVGMPRSASERGNTWAPDWSPDGRSLAFIVAREPTRTVVVRSLETGDEREFDFGERKIGLGASIRWFPDGKSIAVPAFEPGAGESLLRLDVATGRITVLMPLLGSFPAFEISRDGNSLFYVPGHTGDTTRRLVARDLRSGREVEVVARPGFFQSAVSPDGRSLLMSVGEGTSQVLLVRPLAGGDARELARVDGDTEVPFGGAPWWAPDGRHVYFLKGVKGEGHRWHLWRIAAEGGEPQPLGLTVGRQMGGLRLHPDGRRLATTDFTVNLEVWVMENFLPPTAPSSPPS